MEEYVLCAETILWASVYAGVAELVDAQASDACLRKEVEVRVLSPAPYLDTLSIN